MSYNADVIIKTAIAFGINCLSPSSRLSLVVSSSGIEIDDLTQRNPVNSHHSRSADAVLNDGRTCWRTWRTPRQLTFGGRRHDARAADNVRLSSRNEMFFFRGYVVSEIRENFLCSLQSTVESVYRLDRLALGSSWIRCVCRAQLQVYDYEHTSTC